MPNKKDTLKNKDDMINLIDNLNRTDDLTYNRRSFLKAALGASVTLGLATLPFSVKALMDDGEEDIHRVEIIDLEDLPKGQSIKFNYPTEQEPALLVHTVNGELKAYNNKCTHLQCPVFYEKEEDILLCPCHKGYFDINNGQPLAGPPQRELPIVEVEVVGGTVYAIGRTIRHG